MNKNVKTILLVVVGGQGTILVSKILTQGLLKAGFDVKMSEVHGMAQRGGSVSTQVRFGEKVYSPIIGTGGADVLVSFEKMEAVRWADYLKPNAKVIIANTEIPSLPVAIGAEKYPEGTIEAMEKLFDVTVVDADAIAREKGNPRGANIVLLAARIKECGFDFVDWAEVFKEVLPAKILDANLNYFNNKTGFL